MPGEYAPDFARVCVGAAVEVGDSQGFERDALRVEHAEDVVVGLNEECGGVGEGLIFGKPTWVAVAVGGDDGQVTHRFVQLRGD